MKTLTHERDKLKSRVDELSSELRKAKCSERPLSWTNTKTNAKMKFYTGISTILLFNSLFDLIKPCLPNIIYWRGKNTAAATTKPRTQRKQKVGQKDQFLLVLMRLRLGLMNEDLADRFLISPGTCSMIFSTWVKLLGTLIGNASIVWLQRDTIYQNLPDVFKGKHAKTRCIIDCSEVYIERPKSLDDQAATWSDYKQHNTLKFLIGISPSGYVTFLSDCYGGRTSDRHICRDSNFYNLLEAGDIIMDDRGFQIRDDLLHYYCSLGIPPGARVKSQMTNAECSKTKEVANLRIHVERAINRLKEYKILKNTLPINMLPLADEIIRTCAALINFQPPLIRKY